VAVPPEQTDEGPVMTGVGLGFTVNEAELVPAQPDPLVTVTVYVPDEFTDMVCVLALVDHR
jgi:hypothetical protein